MNDVDRQPGGSSDPETRRVRADEPPGEGAAESGPLPQRQAESADIQFQRRQLVGVLADGIAHDLNNLLAGIITGLDLSLMEEGLPAALRDRLTKLAGAARRGADFNKRLLALSRPAGGPPIAVEMPQLLNDAVSLALPALGSHIHLRVAPPPADLGLARAEPGEILQALLNLCLAVRERATSQATIELRLSNESPAADPNARPDSALAFVALTLNVSGGSLGPHFWTSFLAAADSMAGAPGSARITKRIVERNGGRLHAGSAADGPCLNVWLPRVIRPGAPARPPPAVPPSDPADLVGNETILLVDATDASRWVLRAMLAYRGYIVLEANGAEAALRSLEKPESQIALVLLNAELPGLNIRDFTERVSRLNRQVRLLRVNDRPDPAPSAEESPVEGIAVLQAPFRTEEVLRLVRRTLDAVNSDSVGDGR